MMSIGNTIQELQNRSRLSGFTGTGSFQTVGTHGPLVTITEKPQRFTSGATSIQSSFSDRISTLSEPDRISFLSKPVETERMSNLKPPAEVGADEKQATLNQLDHPRSSVSHWANRSAESMNSFDSPNSTTRGKAKSTKSDDSSTVAKLKQHIIGLQKALARKDEENEDLQQMISFLEDTQVAHEQEIERLSSK
ncbi:MAG: hypothetical protein SGBAC_012993 [Bacillariaceae sp.]